MKKNDISDELLGAFVDDELACAENRSIAEQIKYDQELAAKANSMIDLKQAIKQAYPESLYENQQPAGNTDHAGKLSRFFQKSLAASLMLGFGLIAGYYGSEQMHTTTPVFQQAQNDQLYGIQVKPVTQLQDKVLLHVSSADLDKLEFLMNKTEILLQQHHLTNTNFQLDVIANSDGIKLLSSGSSPYEERLLKLTQKHKNLQLIACKNTISRLKKQGKAFQAINGVKIDSPALDTIINRMDKGWTYVKI